jgi:hypothetical protein
MPLDDTGLPATPSACEIRCPQCGRTLRALPGPRCNWCGATIRAEDYALIARQSQHVMAVPAPPPLPPVTSYAQQSPLGGAGAGRAPGTSSCRARCRVFAP